MKVRKRTEKIGIIGLGYVGLPTLVRYANHGFSVIGFEKDMTKFDMLQRSRSYIEDVSDEMLRTIDYEVTTDMEQLQKVDVIFIDVPTPTTSDRKPDLTYVEQACKEVLEHIQLGQLIVLESTVAPATTFEQLVKPLQQKGYKIGDDVFVAFSPERIDPGNKTYTADKIPKVIGGYTEKCAMKAKKIIGQDSFIVSSLEVAELVKLYENTFRFVNIALANEMFRLAEKMNINFDEVLQAAKTKPFGFLGFYPTLGIGGHCIPVDPYYLIDYARKQDVKLPLIRTAGTINDSMLDSFLLKVSLLLNKRKMAFSTASISIIGVTYKKDVADLRMAISHKLSDRLIEFGTNVTLQDDLVVGAKIGKHQKVVEPIDYDFLNEEDYVIVLANHSYLDYDRFTTQYLIVTGHKMGTHYGL